MKDLLWLGAFLLLLAGSELLDAYVVRMKRDDCRASHGRLVHHEGKGCSSDSDVCEEPAR